MSYDESEAELIARNARRPSQLNIATKGRNDVSRVRHSHYLTSAGMLLNSKHTIFFKIKFAIITVNLFYILVYLPKYY